MSPSSRVIREGNRKRRNASYFARSPALKASSQARNCPKAGLRSACATGAGVVAAACGALAWPAAAGSTRAAVKSHETLVRMFMWN